MRLVQGYLVGFLLEHTAVESHVQFESSQLLEAQQVYLDGFDEPVSCLHPMSVRLAAAF